MQTLHRKANSESDPLAVIRHSLLVTSPVKPNDFFHRHSQIEKIFHPSQNTTTCFLQRAGHEHRSKRHFDLMPNILGDNQAAALCTLSLASDRYGWCAGDRGEIWGGKKNRISNSLSVIKDEEKPYLCVVKLITVVPNPISETVPLHVQQQRWKEMLYKSRYI